MKLPNNIAYGFLLGLIANLLGMVLFAVIIGRSLLFWQVIHRAFKLHVLGSFIGCGALLNLILFLFFIRRGSDSLSRGILIATFVSAFITLFLKFI